MRSSFSNNDVLAQLNSLRNELAAKDAELTAKDAKLKQLQLQLAKVHNSPGIGTTFATEQSDEVQAMLRVALQQEAQHWSRKIDKLVETHLQKEVSLRSEIDQTKEELVEMTLKWENETQQLERAHSSMQMLHEELAKSRQRLQEQKQEMDFHDDEVEKKIQERVARSHLLLCEALSEAQRYKTRCAELVALLRTPSPRAADRDALNQQNYANFSSNELLHSIGSRPSDGDRAKALLEASPDKRFAYSANACFFSVSIQQGWQEFDLSRFPPPDCQLDSPIVKLLVDDWTPDKNRKQQFMEWVMSVGRGVFRTYHAFPRRIELSCVPGRVAAGFLTLVFPLLQHKLRPYGQRCQLMVLHRGSDKDAKSYRKRVLKEDVLVLLRNRTLLQVDFRMLLMLPSEMSGAEKEGETVDESVKVQSSRPRNLSEPTPTLREVPRAVSRSVESQISMPEMIPDEQPRNMSREYIDERRKEQRARAFPPHAFEEYENDSDITGDDIYDHSALAELQNALNASTEDDVGPDDSYETADSSMAKATHPGGDLDQYNVSHLAPLPGVNLHHPKENSRGVSMDKAATFGQNLSSLSADLKTAPKRASYSDFSSYPERDMMAGDPKLHPEGVTSANKLASTLGGDTVSSNMSFQPTGAVSVDSASHPEGGASASFKTKSFADVNTTVNNVHKSPELTVKKSNIEPNPQHVDYVPVSHPGGAIIHPGGAASPIANAVQNYHKPDDNGYSHSKQSTNIIAEALVELDHEVSAKDGDGGVYSHYGGVNSRNGRLNSRSGGVNLRSGGEGEMSMSMGKDNGSALVDNEGAKVTQPKMTSESPSPPGHMWI